MSKTVTSQRYGKGWCGTGLLVYMGKNKYNKKRRAKKFMRGLS
ncbi:hypothetical protein TPE_2276 [Treponema pedis str. T A4]|uniref:Uncharacterized protein n=1 Tax=Treponema pedis str. T A4 TaxID=1291379 RepID=S5ZWI6_9SPIR|nr:hypothetical protein TPE_2276 [Treponema pedis str. T A4]